jgi:hypothetical protein
VPSRVELVVCAWIATPKNRMRMIRVDASGPLRALEIEYVKVNLQE